MHGTSLRAIWIRRYIWIYQYFSTVLFSKYLTKKVIVSKIRISNEMKWNVREEKSQQMNLKKKKIWRKKAKEKKTTRTHNSWIYFNEKEMIMPISSNQITGFPLFSVPNSSKLLLVVIVIFSFSIFKNLNLNKWKSRFAIWNFLCFGFAYFQNERTRNYSFVMCRSMEKQWHSALRHEEKKEKNQPRRFSLSRLNFCSRWFKIWMLNTETYSYKS